MEPSERATVVRLAFGGTVDIPLPDEPPSELRYVIYQETPHCVAQGLNVDLSSFGDTPEEAAQNLREAFACRYDLPLEAVAARPLQPPTERVEIPVYAEAV